MSDAFATERRCTLLWEDDRYPELLRKLPNPPKALYVRGEPAVLSEPCLSIIGSRRPTSYGRAVTETAARQAVQAGLTVVSGGAIGLDQVAGEAALGAGGHHIIVLGCGADVVYPSSSAHLIDAALRMGGAVISVVPWGTPPRKFQFPQRNRVIAGLSEAVFIGEAGLPSGTFSTADTAMQMGREALCVPGSVYSPESRGTNYLIESGATCVSGAEALLVAFSRLYGIAEREIPTPPGMSGVNRRTERLLASMVAQPLSSDDVCRLVGIDIRACLEYLSSLMVAGLIEQRLDGRYAPTKETLHALSAFGHNGA